MMDSGATSNSLPRCIFVAGYGRSGSTLLDSILGAAPDCVGVGELRWLFFQSRNQLPCSCGMQFEDCPYWSSRLVRLRELLSDKDFAEADAVSERIEHVRSRKRWWLPGKHGEPNETAARYGRIWRTVFEVLGDGRAIVVDSSKTNVRTYFRAQALSSLAGVPVRVLHLVRDVRAVLYSSRRKLTERQGNQLGARKQDSSARTALSWWLSNNAAERASAELPSSIRVRYEQLVAAPAESLLRIAAATDVDLSTISQLVAAGEGLESGHGVSGNRWRRQGKLVLRADEEWRGNRRISSEILRVALWPMMRRYGY